MRLALWLTALPLAAASAEAKDPPRVHFALCQKNVASVSVFPGARPGLRIQLTTPAKMALARLTEANTGARLRIVYADQTFSEGPLHHPIRSGMLGKPGFSTLEEAEAAKADLENQLPEAPCGAGERAAPKAR